MEKWVSLVMLGIVAVGVVVAVVLWPRGAEEPEPEALLMEMVDETVSAADEPVADVPEPSPEVVPVAEEQEIEAPEEAEEAVVAEVTKPMDTELPAEDEEGVSVEIALSANDVQEYATIVKGIVRHTRRRDYDGAEEFITSWLEESRGHVLEEQVGYDLERVAKAKGLFAVLEENKYLLQGTTVRAKPKLEGSLVDIDGRVVTLARATMGGEARFAVRIERVYERDFAKLLKLAAPDDFLLNMAVVGMTKGQFDKAYAMLNKAEAAGRDVSEYRTWLQDWEKALLNGGADDAIDEMMDLVAEGDFPEAQSVLWSAKQAYSTTDVFTWVRKDEVEQLAAAIERGMSELKAEEMAAEEAEEEDEDQYFAVTPEEDARVEQLDVPELSENLLSFHGQLVKLSFRARGDIKQVDGSTYRTQLGEGGAFLPVEFPEEGYKYIRNIGKWTGRRRKTLYGVVDADGQKVKLIGRTKTTPLGGQAVEYSW
jgi:hypothetical protein